ncbi:exodeoxyribonuclease V subunit gamma [Nocardioides limicola]|uniref:exodeoxyribonuclease V subunit gamma n=1 Tax=Nocardioides limicola TaxID=2803368 RepID=UPI00193C84D5|nr:exodeoxyribonuclease V subunit gamma [Nocardioides sp. DJM-14]
MPVHLHHAPSTDVLADGLARLLSDPLPDPFATEVVVVPTRGVERWLAQRLSHRLGAAPGLGDGVCAGVRFLNPRSLVAMVTGSEDDDPWDPDRLVWPLLATIDAHLDADWCRPLARHLGEGRDDTERDLRRARRWATAHRLATRFASYAVQRPGLLADWRAGQDSDGAGGHLAPDLAWQAELWRRLLEVVPADPPEVRHHGVLDQLREAPGSLDLPERLSLFGHTRIPVTELELLQALATHREVHLWLPQVSRSLWEAQGQLGDSVVPRDQDRSVELVGHPLLASLGRDARELRRAVAPLLADATAETLAGPPAPATLLGWLQDDLRDNHAPTPAERGDRHLAEDDRSVQVHACHGPARQVEVLREVLVGLMQDQPDLEPRDIVVMCPDIESYAPLIQSAFGLAPADTDGWAGHPGHRLRLRLADRSLRATNPLLAVAGHLLTLAAGRATAAEVLDLAGAAPCRMRFSFDDDGLERLHDWVDRAAVRWGLSAELTLTRYGLGQYGGNTFAAGLERILAGVALSDDERRPLGRAVPVDDIGSDELDLAGDFAEFLDRLERCLAALAQSRSVADWLAALRDGVRALTRVAAADAWQLPQLERELAGIGAAAQNAPTELSLPDVRAMLEQRLAGRPTRANFRTGAITVATLTPMRSIPHRVVCLLGLDDQVFPRGTLADGDDVLLRRPMTGERDRRGEDRQLLLDAILAAREHLVVTYSGADERSGAERPPAVPLAELLAALDRTTADPVAGRVLTRHPLQAHDRRNFAGRSFDAAARDGAAAAAAERTPPPELLAAPLTALPAADVTVEELRAFLTHPVRTFFKERLDVGAPLTHNELPDAIPIELDHLATWQIGDRLLAELLAGGEPGALLTLEQLRGTLPPGALAAATLEPLVRDCQALWQASARFRSAQPATIDVDVDLGGGRRLIGTVAGVHDVTVLSMRWGRVKAAQRLGLWVDLLALAASRPDTAWLGCAVGKAGGRSATKVAVARGLRADVVDPVETLRDLVALRDLGLTTPVACPVETGAAWAERARRHRDSAGQAAAREWTTDRFNGYPKEDADPYHALAFGVGADVDVLLGRTPAAAALPAAAERIWSPLLASEWEVAM